MKMKTHVLMWGKRLVFTVIILQESATRIFICHSFSSLPPVSYIRTNRLYNGYGKFQFQVAPLSRQSSSLVRDDASFDTHHNALAAHSTSAGNNDDDGDGGRSKGSDWKVGDFESDLQILRSAVAKANAQTVLDEKERLELLDEFARQRRELMPDLRRYILGPTLMAGIFSIPLLGSSTRYGRKSVLAFVKLMNVAFWTVSVLIPLGLYFLSASKSTRKQPSEWRRRKSEWEAEYIDLREDCSDYSKCILENLTSSAIPSATVGLVSLILQMDRYVRLTYAFEPLPLHVEAQYFTWKLVSLMVQMISRLGSASSMYQFPKLLYELKQSNRNRPTPWLPSAVKNLVDCSMLLLPFGYAADLAQVCVSSVQIHRIGRSSNHLFSFSTFSRGTMMKIAYIALLGSTIAQICHLIAFKKLLRFGYFTDVSLAMNDREARKLLEENDNDNSDKFGVKLRYRLKWREPKRLTASFRQMRKNFLLFVLTGWGDDAAIVEQHSYKSVPHILKLVKKDMDENPDAVVPDRSTWVPSATRRMATIHQENYDNKTFEDPLGIAFQQTFGIGLSFDFDHQSKLIHGELPSIHRLRARAAKSAIQRYNAIPEIVKQEVSRTNYNVDPKLRDEEVQRLIVEERLKLKSFANELITLIPSNAHAPEGKDLDVLSMRNSEANAFIGEVNLPFLNEENPDDDEFVVDPYLGDNIFLGKKTITT